MYRTKITSLLFFVAFFCATTVFAQKVPSENNEKQEDIHERVEKRPDLGFDISKIAKLKIFLRKNEYHLNEMVILDVAMLTTKEADYYFPTDLEELGIIIKDKSGNFIDSYPMAVGDDFRVSLERFRDELVIKSFQLIIGCQEEKYNIPRGLLGSDNNKVLFDNNIFRTLGNWCIDVKNAEELEISVELTNVYVIVPKNKENIKTAVGKIRSNSLKIYIKK